MSTLLTRATLGYTDETTFGTRIPNPPVAGTAHYALGAYLEGIPFPVERPVIVERDVLTSFDAHELKYGKKEVRFTVPYQVLEGQPLQYIHGLNADAGPAGNIYTHTITGIEPANQATPETRTFHWETAGLTTQKIIDVHGAASEQLDISWITGDARGLLAQEKFVGQMITDEAATKDNGGGAGDYKAVARTTAPALITSSMSEAYPFRVSEIKYGGSGGTDIISDVFAGNISTKVEWEENRSLRGTTNEYSDSMNPYLSALYIKKRRQFITLTVSPTDNIIYFFNKIQNPDYNTDLYIKATRTVGAETHTLVWTFDTTTCPVTNVTGLIKYVLADNMKWTVVLQPKTMVSLVSSDENATYSL